jgi:drug/metabolite transporter (DMT)-like permease
MTHIKQPNRADHAVCTASGFRTTVFSIDLGFTFQVIARKHTPPKDTFLILSLEAVFVPLFGRFFMQELLLPMQLAG